MSIKNFFFDFDGTLCDTDADIRLAWQAALAEIDLPHADFESVYRNGPPIDEVTRGLYGEQAATPELIDRVRSLFRAHYDGGGFPRTRPYPGVDAGLRALKDAGAALYICTNKRFRATNLLVDKLGWRPLFNGVYSSDMFMDTPIGKLRKSALLAEALRREGASAAETVMVGDTANDFEAARANGLASVGCAWGYGGADDLALADRVIASFAELVRRAEGTANAPGTSTSNGRKDMNDFYAKAARVLEVPAAEVDADTRFRGLDGWCSLKAFGLLAMMENDFGAALSIDEFRTLETLGALAARVGGAA